MRADNDDRLSEARRQNVGGKDNGWEATNHTFGYALE